MVTFLGSIIKVLHANNLGFEYTLHQEIDGKPQGCLNILHATKVTFGNTVVALIPASKTDKHVFSISFKGEFITITQTEDATVSRLIEYLR
jgi:hypothetical protein